MLRSNSAPPAQAAPARIVAPFNGANPHPHPHPGGGKGAGAGGAGNGRGVGRKPQLKQYGAATSQAGVGGMAAPFMEAVPLYTAAR
jgi:hypothetical protein